MKKLLKVLWQRFLGLFKKTEKKALLGSSEETHWVLHTFDRSYRGGQHSDGGWVNVHGFSEGPNVIWWACFDNRWMGIRVQDIVIKCKNKATYDKYIAMGRENALAKIIKEDPAFWCSDGDDTNIEFTFKWKEDGDTEDKSFNVRLPMDRFAVEK